MREKGARTTTSGFVTTPPAVLSIEKSRPTLSNPASPSLYDGDREAADLDELAEHNPDRFEGEATTDNTVEEMLAAYTDAS